MARINTCFKAFTYFCSFLLVFQSCTAYYKTHVTLKEAYESQNNVRIKTLDNKTIKYRRIGFENDKYHGLFKHENELVKMGIKEDAVETFQIKDNKTSTILSIAIPVAIVGDVIGITAHALDTMKIYGN